MSWVERLTEIVGASAVDHFAPTGSEAQTPRVAPEGEEQWRAVLELARSSRLCCRPVGSGSRLQPVDVAHVDLWLSTRREAGVVAYEPGDGTLTARAGTPWSELAQTVAGGGHHLSPEFPPAAPGTLGGVIASASSGFERLRYGPVRHQVLGLRFLLADGTPAQSGGRLVKNVTGYDLHRLLTGSAGSLAVILEGSLRLAPEPAKRRALVARFGDPEALLAATTALRDLPLTPEALRVRGDDAPGLELALFLAGRSATVDWELERARAAVPALEEPPDAAALRAAAVVAENGAGRGRATLRLALRPSRLAEIIGGVERLLETHDLAPWLSANPWLATLTYDFQGSDSGAVGRFATNLPGLLAPCNARHHWSGTASPCPMSEPSPEVRRYGARLRQALDPHSLFAGAPSHA